MRNHRPLGATDDMDNQTTVFLLSSSNWEIEDGEELPERLIPTKVITYPTSVSVQEGPPITIHVFILEIQ